MQKVKLLFSNCVVKVQLEQVRWYYDIIQLSIGSYWWQCSAF